MSVTSSFVAGQCSNNVYRMPNFSLERYETLPPNADESDAPWEGGGDATFTMKRNDHRHTHTHTHINTHRTRMLHTYINIHIKLVSSFYSRLAIKMIKNHPNRMSNIVFFS